MIVPAGVDVVELLRFMIMALGLDAIEEKAFNLVGGVEGVALAREELLGVSLEHAANVGGIGRAALVDDIAEHQHFAGTKNVGRAPVERWPVNAQAEIALALRGEAANRGAIEGQVVPALEQELLVVVEHVQAAFEVAEQHGDRLDALLVGQVLQALLLDLMQGDAVLALLFGAQIQVFELVIGKREEATQFSGHGSPRNKFGRRRPE